MKTHIMAIINVSPDSFAGDGVTTLDGARERIKIAIHNGATILDIGGQSTRPGAEIISDEEEIARIVPVINLAQEMTDVRLSVDTFKPAVARIAVQAGVTIINDITGGVNKEMRRLIATNSQVQLVVMHSRGTPQTMTQLTDYPRGVVPEIIDFFCSRTRELVDEGVSAEQIIIDPGIGFAKTARQSFTIFQQLDTLVSLGFPVLIGVSMKSSLGWVLSDNGQTPVPVERRSDATTATTTYAALRHVAIVRVHNVRAAHDALAVVDAIENPDHIPGPR